MLPHKYTVHMHGTDALVNKCLKTYINIHNMCLDIFNVYQIIIYLFSHLKITATKHYHIFF